MTATHGTARTIAIAAGIGAASGLLSFLVPEALDQAGVDDQGRVAEWLVRLSPGIVYGAVIGLYLKSVGMTTLSRAAAFVPLDTASWFAAYWFAIDGAETLGLPLKELWQLGIVSGLIGASIVALSALLLFPFFRRWKLAVTTILAGGAVGVLLSFGVIGSGLIVLFTIWQGAVAACFGWGVAQARENL